MPTFEKCDDVTRQMAHEILIEFPSHKPVLDAGVKIDLVFAYSDKNEKGIALNVALKKGGVRALGICRKIPTKDRVLGRADAEISLDGDWWLDASAEERAALLDHELHHIEVVTDERGTVVDSAGRPKLRLRPHDYEFGWFKAIAARHGSFSQERLQAAKMFEESGQYFWPQIAAIQN